MTEIVLTPFNATIVGPVNIVTNATEVTCVYYGGVHLFEECSVNYVS